MFSVLERGEERRGEEREEKREERRGEKRGVREKGGGEEEIAGRERKGKWR